MPRPPVVVDTNVVVSGLLTADASAPTARIVDAMLAAALPFVLSVELLGEYRCVLLRPAIRERHGLDEAAIDQILSELAVNGMVRELGSTEEGAPDPGDQHLWDLLAAVPRAVLVTGDSLLRRRAPRGTIVMSPAEFVDAQLP